MGLAGALYRYDGLVQLNSSVRNVFQLTGSACALFSFVHYIRAQLAHLQGQDSEEVQIISTDVFWLLICCRY